MPDGLAGDGPFSGGRLIPAKASKAGRLNAGERGGLAAVPWCEAWKATGLGDSLK